MKTQIRLPNTPRAVRIQLLNAKASDMTVTQAENETKCAACQQAIHDTQPTLRGGVATYSSKSTALSSPYRRLY
jgi:hypothetical protein